jgi:chemotaxis protein CheD
MIEQTTPVSPERLIHIHQGECRISEDQRVVLTTMLGSCIAACLHDPVAGVGGMNHFLLPDTEESDRSASLRYGANAMELLVNGLLSIGAKRERLEAKLFGGGRMTDGLTDIGEKNAKFAELYLKHEGIPLLGGSMRGRDARRIQFWPVSGRVRQLVLNIKVEAITKLQPQSANTLPRAHGSVELF